MRKEIERVRGQEGDTSKRKEKLNQVRGLRFGEYVFIIYTTKKHIYVKIALWQI